MSENSNISTCSSDTNNKDLIGDEDVLYSDEDENKDEDEDEDKDEEEFSENEEEFSEDEEEFSEDEEEFSEDEEEFNEDEEEFNEDKDEDEEEFNEDKDEDEEEFYEDLPYDEAKLPETINIVNERAFCTRLEILGTLEPKYLIEQLGGLIELIQSHPDPQLDVMSKCVLQYLHFWIVMSGNKVAEKYFRFFKNIIKDKNLERKISKCRKEDAIKFFCKNKFKVKLSKGTFLALRKKLESEKRIDILQIMNLFFDFEYDDEEEKLESEMKKRESNNSCTTVISSQPSSSKAKENTKKGSAPIRQAEYSDNSSSSDSQHEFNCPKANQTDQNTTKPIEEMSLAEIKNHFSKMWCKSKKCHFIAIPKGDIVSAADATDFYVVCGFESSLIRVWSICNRWIIKMRFVQRCILRGHKGIVNSVEINSELQRLISGSSDKTVRIWDLKMRTCLSVHAWHSEAVFSVCWSPTSKCVLSSSADSTAVLCWYEITQMSVYRHNKKTDVAIYVARFHPNGTYFATAAADGSIALWTIDNNRSCLRWFDNDEIKVNTISFSPCGKFLAAGDKTGWISVWEISKELVKHFNLKASGIKHLCYNKSRDAIAAIFFDATWCIFHPSTEGEVLFFKRPAGTITRSIHFTISDKLLLIEN